MISGLQRYTKALQKELRQPKTLIFWGQNDIFFTREGGEAYLRDLPNAEMHRLASGHFAVEDCPEQIVSNIQRFYDEKVTPVAQTSAREKSDKRAMDTSGSMKVISVNCGLPRQVVWHGRNVSTAIYKEPVKGRIVLRKLNLDGDRQADLSVHGGAYKAVYCYPAVHYDYWKAELPGRELPIGIFGENFTIDGLLEESVHVGDRFSVGSAEVVATQPRLPCYKLGVRFESDDMVKRFLASRRTGFYLAVTREGDVGAGDRMTMIGRDRNSVPVPWITRLYVTKKYGSEDIALVQRAITVPALPESWKEYFRERLQRTNA